MIASAALFTVLSVSPACQGNGNTSTALSLESYLPDQPGHRWNYWGFAEYGHWMEIDEITRLGSETVYSISGMVEDMSDGDSGSDYSVSLKYMVTDSVLKVAQQPSMLMDNDFSRMELLRLPLTPGSSWTQTATDKNGEEVELLSEIEETGEGTITVRYSLADSPFYQLRVFEEGLGMVTFEKLYITPDGNFEIGYTLFRGNY